MSEHTFRINGLEEYPQAAKWFTGFLQKGNIFAFYGKMGSGNRLAVPHDQAKTVFALVYFGCIHISQLLCLLH